METKHIYTGLTLGTTHEVLFRQTFSVKGGQDGSIFGDYLFRFDARGRGIVYSMKNGEKLADFTLDKSDILCMHSNAVDFSPHRYDTSDDFPLLYTNIYNNYSKGKATDRKCGVCGVYRILRQEGVFTSQLVQVVRIGFTDDPVWRSENLSDVRPYGNFVVDSDENRLVAFTMRDEDRHTRFFSFSLPHISEGVLSDEYGVPVVNLAKSDILDCFNGDYSNYIQGACCRGGKIYSTEGFSEPTIPACIQVFDIRAKRTHARISLFHYSMTIEPEFAAFSGDILYYSDAHGNMWEITFP